MRLDNVVPLYDLFEGKLYSPWQRIIIFIGFGIIIGMLVYTLVRGLLFSLKRKRNKV